MSNNWTAFKILDEDVDDPIGHHLIYCHMVFNVNMNFQRRYHCVAVDHNTEPPASMTYW